MSSAFELMERNRKMMDLAMGRGPVFDMMERTRKLTDLTSGRGPVFDLMERTRELTDMATGRGPLGISSMLDVDTHARVARRPDLFAAVMPRAEWQGVLEPFRDLLSDDAAVDGLSDELDEVEPTAGNQLSWLHRLTFVQQLGLYVAALELLDAVGVLLADAADLEVPAEVRSATQVVFALVGFLLLVMEAQRKDDDS